jgi:hypothetical protein
MLANGWHSDKRAERRLHTAIPLFAAGLMYGLLGDKEEALRWLEKSYQDRGPALGRIKNEPFLDPLRGDPRFEELVTKVFAPKNGSSP